MGVFQIIGLSILGIIVLFMIFGHIMTLEEWKRIEVGDTGTYIDNHDGYHNISCNIEVIEKHKDYIVIKYCDDTKETIYKYQFTNLDKIFKWDKYGKID